MTLLSEISKPPTTVKSFLVTITILCVELLTIPCLLQSKWKDDPYFRNWIYCIQFVVVLAVNI